MKPCLLAGFFILSADPSHPSLPNLYLSHEVVSNDCLPLAGVARRDEGGKTRWREWLVESQETQINWKFYGSTIRKVVINQTVFANLTQRRAMIVSRWRECLVERQKILFNWKFYGSTRRGWTVARRDEGVALNRYLQFHPVVSNDCLPFPYFYVLKKLLCSCVSFVQHLSFY